MFASMNKSKYFQLFRYIFRTFYNTTVLRDILRFIKMNWRSQASIATPNGGLLAETKKIEVKYKITKNKTLYWFSKIGGKSPMPRMAYDLLDIGEACTEYK